MSAVLTIPHTHTHTHTQDKVGVPASKYRMLFDGEQFALDSTFSDIGIQSGDIIDVPFHRVGGCIVAPVPAAFGADASSLGAEYLTQPAVLAQARPSDAIVLASALGGDLGIRPDCRPDVVLLDAVARASLIAWLDTEHANTAGIANDDLRRTVTTDSLRARVGPTAVDQLARAFGGPLTMVRMRRVAASGGHVTFHTDTHSRRTMQVALNGDDEYSGGRLVFATAAGFEVPTRAAGSATIHTHGVVHGVTALTSGVRYSLFVCDAVSEPLPGSMLSPTAVDLTYLEDAVVNQLAFFASVMPLVDTCTSQQMSAYVEEYRSWFASGEPIGVAALSLGAVLAWRVHMLHPVAYLHARATGRHCRSEIGGAVGRDRPRCGNPAADNVHAAGPGDPLNDRVGGGGGSGGHGVPTVRRAGAVDGHPGPHGAGRPGVAHPPAAPRTLLPRMHRDRRAAARSR
jgi:hypothetical protein